MIRRQNNTAAVVAPEPQKTLLDYALDAIRRGWYVLPCYPRTKVPAGRVVPHGVDQASNNEAQIRAWWAVDPNFNPAIALGPSGLVVWDYDKIAPPADVEPTYTVQTGRDPAKNNGIPGIQMYYVGSCDTHDITTGKDEKGQNIIVGEVRSRGAYVMAPGCIHPKSGRPYIKINDVPLAKSPINTEAKPIVVGPIIGTEKQNEIRHYIEFAFDATNIEYESPIEHKGGMKWLIRCPWESTHTEGKPFNTSSTVILWPDGKIIYSCQHAHCKGVHLWISQKDPATGQWDPAKIGLREWMENTVGGKLVFSKQSEDEQVRYNGEFSKGVVMPDWAYDTEEKKPMSVTDSLVNETESKSEALLEVSSPEKDLIYDMKAEEIAYQDENVDFPAYKLHLVPGPDFDEKHLYGVLGRIAKKMCQSSEAHVTTVYLNLIVSFGNMIGRGPYFNVDNTTQYTNEFLACAGESALARKGLAGDVVALLVSLVDAYWFANRNCGGFSTPQAVLSEIKDDSIFQRLDGKSGEYKTMTQPGVRDKRLCIREGELSNVFKLLSDSQQKAAELVRNLWDSKPVSNRVAGKTEVGEHNTLICREPHVSIIGSTTPSLAKATLPIGADKSGDGNRFIWCYVKRTQHCPFGGPPIDWATEVVEFRGEMMGLLAYLIAAISEAREVGLMPISRAATKYWKCLYRRLEADPRTGFLGGMTARAAAHIRRVAMILALMDRETVIAREHLEAAEAIWDYSQESARYIFTGMSLDGVKIVRSAEVAGNAGITATDVHKLFSGHKPAHWVRAQLAVLVKGDFLTQMKEQSKTEGAEKLRDIDVFRFKKWQ